LGRGCFAIEPAGVEKALWCSGMGRGDASSAGEEGSVLAGCPEKKALFKAPEMEYNEKRKAAGKGRGTKERGEQT